MNSSKNTESTAEILNPSLTAKENGYSCTQDLTRSEIEELRADLKTSLVAGREYIEQLDSNDASEITHDDIEEAKRIASPQM